MAKDNKTKEIHPKNTAQPSKRQNGSDDHSPKKARNPDFHARSAAIIIKDNKIALMHRLKNRRKYYIFPGGTIEKGETPAQTAVREIKEELSLTIEISHLLWVYEDELHYGFYFLAKNPVGEIKLGGEEAIENSPANSYTPKWVPLEKLPTLTLYPLEIRDRIITSFINKHNYE